MTVVRVARHAGFFERPPEATADDVDRTGAGPEPFVVDAVLGESPEWLDVLATARRVALTDAAVFIRGESGTGKEVVARYIHHFSPRRSRRMIAVNCAALPESLFESELFGHRRGAFTGAVRDKPGILEMAHGGTVFLDEALEMPTVVQAKLLRVLQDGVVRRVGSETADARVDVRIITATNRDPADALRRGELREDLFYRLHVVPIQLPPLRERPEDIPVLARHFLAQQWRRHRAEDGPAPTFSPEALWALAVHPWRGNVRELLNMIEHLVVLARPAAPISADEIPIEGTANRGDRPVPDGVSWCDAAVFGQGYHAARRRILSHFETAYAQWLVRRCGDGTLTDAARRVGMHRTTLYRLLRRRDRSVQASPRL
jgi:transcriptional regulator with PAS, ATPase and Fis domain